MSERFYAISGFTVTISATTTESAAASISEAYTPQVRVANVGSVVTFVALGSSTIEASILAVPLLPNTSVIFERSEAQTHISVKTASSTATVYVTPVFAGI